MEISRSLGCEPIGFDVQTVRFSSKHVFDVNETVLISRTTRGWSYGQITEQVESKECVFDSRHKHGMVMWKVTYFNNQAKQMYKVLPSSLVGKLQTFSSVPPSPSSSIPVLTSPPTMEEARALMGKAPSAGQVAMSLFVSNKVLTRHELVLVPRSSGGFSFGIIDSQVGDFPCPALEGQAGGFLTRGCRVLVGEKANKVVSPSNVGKLLFHLPPPFSSSSSSSSSVAKGEKSPMVEEDEEEFVIDEDVMSALTANFADLDPDSPDEDGEDADQHGLIDPATAGDELDEEEQLSEGEGEGEEPGKKPKGTKEKKTHHQHPFTHYQPGGHKKKPHANPNAHPTTHHTRGGGGGGRGGLVYKSSIRQQPHEVRDIPLGSLLLGQIDDRLRAPPSRRIVIDGPNVAFLEGTDRHKFYDAQQVINCVEFWRNLGHSTTVIFPAQYFYDDNNKFGPEGFSALLPYINDGTIIQTPSGEYDDSYTIKFAMMKEAYIVSNDMFRDFSTNLRINNKDVIRKIVIWIKTHRISFTIMDSQFVPRPEFSF